MKYALNGISFSDLQNIHNFFHPRTVMTLSWFDKSTGLYNIDITTNAIIKINNGDITIDLGAKLLTIPSTNYTSLHISWKEHTQWNSITK